MKFLNLNLVCIFALLFNFAWFPSKSMAQATEAQLIYAGFAFEGNYENRRERYPLVAELQESYPAFISELFLTKVNSQTYTAIRNKLSLEEADVNRDPILVAFTLTQESIEVQIINNQFWGIVVLQANILAFNNSSNSVVGSYPVRLRITRVFSREPNKEEIKAIVREAFSTSNSSENLIDLWLTKLTSSKFKNGSIKRLRVVDVTLGKEAKDYLEKFQINDVTFRSSIASDLETTLSAKSGIPLLPNTVGEAIGNAIALRFSDKSIQIKIPDTDYEVLFNLRGFASAKTEAVNSITNIYRVKSNLKIKLNGEMQDIFNEDFFETKFLTRPKGVSIFLNEWTQYKKTNQDFITDLGSQLISVQDGWLIEHASRGIEAKSSFNKAKKLLQDLNK
jgi:hypothetical protein